MLLILLLILLLRRRQRLQIRLLQVLIPFLRRQARAKAVHLQRTKLGLLWRRAFGTHIRHQPHHRMEAVEKEPSRLLTLGRKDLPFVDHKAGLRIEPPAVGGRQLEVIARQRLPVAPETAPAAGVSGAIRRIGEKCLPMAFCRPFGTRFALSSMIRSRTYWRVLFAFSGTPMRRQACLAIS